MDYLSGIIFRKGFLPFLYSYFDFLLIHVKFLSVETYGNLNSDSLSQLINLEELYIIEGLIADYFKVIKLVAVLTKLHKVCIAKMECQTQGFKKDLLANLNEQRLKLSGACKTTVYLPDQAYVAIKSVSDRISYSHIELKRAETYTLKYPYNNFKFVY